MNSFTQEKASEVIRYLLDNQIPDTPEYNGGKMNVKELDKHISNQVENPKK
jgi:hypothetical protein